MKPIYRSNGSYMCRIIASAPLLYFPFNEQSGLVAKNWGSLGIPADGSYTGVDLAAMSGPKGGLAPYFDGANDFVSIYSAALVAAFSGSAGTMMIWAKVYDASIWTYATYRILMIIKNDASNWVDIDRTTANNRIYVIYRANGINSAPGIVVSTLDWFHIALTWDAPNDIVRGYLNGVQQGADINGLGVFSGTPDSRWCCIGAGSNTPTAVFNGYLAHAALWDRALSPSEILLLGQ